MSPSQPIRLHAPTHLPGGSDPLPLGAMVPYPYSGFPCGSYTGGIFTGTNYSMVNSVATVYAPTDTGPARTLGVTNKVLVVGTLAVTYGAGSIAQMNGPLWVAASPYPETWDFGDIVDGYGFGYAVQNTTSKAFLITAVAQTGVVYFYYVDPVTQLTAQVDKTHPFTFAGSDRISASWFGTLTISDTPNTTYWH